VGTCEQVVGIEDPVGMEVSPITCIGTELASSLLLVDPPVAGVLVLKVTLGKLSVESSDAGILNPLEPVSTATLGMVTQLVVEPGVQT
jgi:hypothetical protein